jgi:hypothetical protein
MAVKLGYNPKMLLVEGAAGDLARKSVDEHLAEERAAREAQMKGQTEHYQKLYGARIAKQGDEFNDEALVLYQHPQFYSDRGCVKTKSDLVVAPSGG